MYDLFACWPLVLSGVVLLYSVRCLSDEAEGGAFIRLENRSFWCYGLQLDVTKIAAKDERSFRFCNEEITDDLYPCTDLKNQFNSLNEGYCFYTHVSSVRYTHPFLDISPHMFRKLMESYKSRASSSIEDNNEAFRRLYRLPNVRVYLIFTHQQGENAFGSVSYLIR